MGGSYGARGGGMGGRGMGRGGSDYGGEGGSYGGRGGGRGGYRPEHDFVEGKLFLGGLDTQTTKETLVNYCTQWCAFNTISKLMFRDLLCHELQDIHSLWTRYNHPIRSDDKHVSSRKHPAPGKGFYGRLVGLTSDYTFLHFWRNQ